MSRGYPVRGGPTRCRVSQSILTSATDSVMKSLQRQAIHVTLVATRTAVLAVVQRAPRMPALGSKPHGGVGELSDAVVVAQVEIALAAVRAAAVHVAGFMPS